MSGVGVVGGGGPNCSRFREAARRDGALALRGVKQQTREKVRVGLAA